jgi:DNA repair exonuclease SbcCD ATPase subunit
MAARTVIHALRVDGTGFLTPFDLLFTPGLNCIIGARGTGKTSILELIRFAAGREIDTESVESSVGNLVPVVLGEAGYVEIDVTTPLGQSLTIHRDVNGQWSATDRSTGEAAEIQWPALGVYDLAIFSQNQLEDVATSPAGRLATLDSFCGSDVERIKDGIRNTQERLSVNAAQQTQLMNQIEALRSQGDALPRLHTELAAVEQQYQQALKDLAGQEPIKKKVEELSAGRQALAREESLLSSMLEDAERALLETFPGRLLGDRLRQGLSEEAIAPLPDREMLRAVRSTISRASQQYAEHRAAMTNSLTDVRDTLLNARGDVGGRLTALNREYQTYSNQLGALSQAWKEVAAKRDALLSQVRTLESAALAIEQHKVHLTGMVSERAQLMARLNSLFEDRFVLRQSAAGEINAAIGGTVIVEVLEGGSPERYQQYLIQALRGSGIQYSRLIAAIVATVPPQRLAEMARGNEPNALAAAASVDLDRARRALVVLSDAKTTFELETIDVEDAVSFALETSPGTYRPSDALSQGQKCTTVLSLLLVDSVDPLVIDQPEDNLDNSYVVSTVVSVVARQQADRQFIFVTHNPNIPVLAEAQHVVAMDAANGKGAPAAQGRWDEPQVMDRIMSVMEGGREAFARRQRAYSSPGSRLASG